MRIRWLLSLSAAFLLVPHPPADLSGSVAFPAILIAGPQSGPILSSLEAIRRDATNLEVRIVAGTGGKSAAIVFERVAAWEIPTSPAWFEVEADDPDAFEFQFKIVDPGFYYFRFRDGGAGCRVNEEFILHSDGHRWTPARVTYTGDSDIGRVDKPSPWPPRGSEGQR